MSEPDEKACCGNCPHFALTNVQEGECHADPPKVFPMPGPGGRGMGALGLFPPCRSDNWCSRHPMLTRRWLGDPIAKG